MSKLALLSMTALATLAAGTLWFATRVDLPAAAAVERDATSTPAASETELRDEHESVSSPVAVDATRTLARSVVAQGTVVDEQYAPITGAAIEVTAMDTDAVRFEPLRAITDAHGRFEVLGDAPAQQLKITAKHRDAIEPATRTTKAGETETKLMLVMGGALAANVLVSCVHVPGELSLVLMSDERRRLERDVSWNGGDAAFRVDGSGTEIRQIVDGARDESAISIVFHGLREGTFTLRAHFFRGEPALVEIASLRVVAREQLEDPRLSPLDLRAFFAEFALTIVDVEQSPIQAGHVQIVSPDDAARAKSVEIARGEAQFVARTREVEVEVSAPGYRKQHCAIVERKRRIVLERGPAVRIVLDGARAPTGFGMLRVGLDRLATDKGKHWYVHPTWIDDPIGARIDWMSQPFFRASELDAIDTALVYVEEPGEYTVTWFVAAPNGDRGMLKVSEIGFVGAPRITVTDGMNLVRSGFDPALLQRALDPH